MNYLFERHDGKRMIVNWDKVVAVAQGDAVGSVIYFDVFGHGDLVAMPVNEDLSAVETALGRDGESAVRQIRP